MLGNDDDDNINTITTEIFIVHIFEIPNLYYLMDILDEFLTNDLYNENEMHDLEIKEN